MIWTSSFDFHTNGKHSKILNMSLFLFSNKMLVFRAGVNNKMLVRKDPDQTTS